MPPDGRRSARAGLIAGLIAFALLAITEPMLAIVWDEGYTLGRERRIRSWLSALADPQGFSRSWEPPPLELVQPDGPPPPGREPVVPPSRDQLATRARLLAPEVIAYFWPFAREEPHGHPPFYALLGLAGDLLTPWRDDLGRARLGPMLLFSLAAGALFSFLDRRLGRWAAIAGAAALVLQPRLFGHAHYAAYDAPLTALWVLGVLSFARATEDSSRSTPRWGWAVVFGLVAGASASTKLTGWFLPLPMLAWVAAFRDRRGLLTLLAAGPVALAAIYVFIPPWWHDPVDGVLRFLASNTGRAETIPIRTMYLGKVYRTPIDSLPPDNTLILTAMVTPIGFLALAVVGALRSAVAGSTERFGVLVLLHWLMFLVLRALPNVPGHDGVRLFLPAFGMLAIAAGLGAGDLVNRVGRWGKLIVSAAVIEGAASVAVMMPVPLSYYSPAVGGLPGAARLGMEPTYYWDAMTPGVLSWLDEHSPDGASVVPTTFPTSFLFLNESGRLRAAIVPIPTPKASWFVVQNRTGELDPIDRALIRDHEPAFVLRKLGVPLLWVFPMDAVRAVEEAMRPPPRAFGPSSVETFAP
ncbi:glycosyltransferase family 39 protein [Tautonia sociabilis]|nr:glycosyltransferase family 39 protein [Tautonia sociabilis]